MDLSTSISEDRIRKAYQDGEFDNLPGMGKPLPPDEFAHLPDDIRMAYRILKNAGYNPEANRLKQEIVTIEDLIANCSDEEERGQLQKKLNEKMFRFKKVMSKRGTDSNTAMFKNYQEKVSDKMSK